MQNKSRKWLTVSGRSKQAKKHTHIRVQWSHASVGLTQACPNEYIWMIEWSIIHAFWMPGSMVRSLHRESWLCHPSREGLAQCLKDAWVSDSSANTASVANVWVNCPYISGCLWQTSAAVRWQTSAQACAEAAIKWHKQVIKNI